MAGNCLTSTTGTMQQAAGAGFGSGQSWTRFHAFMWQSFEVTNWRGAWGITGASNFEFFQSGANHDNNYQLQTDTGSEGYTGTPPGTTYNGIWTQTALSYNGATGDTNVYAVRQQFNPASPGYLLTVSLGTFAAVGSGGSLFSFVDFDGDDPTGIFMGREIISLQLLSEANIKLQFKSATPIPAVKGGTYSYYPNTSTAALGVDQGNRAVNYTVTNAGSFTESRLIIPDWNSETMMFAIPSG